MNLELNFEQLQKKLKKVLNPTKFRFVVILYPNTNMIKEIKNHIKDIYPQSLVTSLDLKNKSYQDVSSELYKNDEGFVYIDDFEEILDNSDLYNGFNQRRDKIASHNINLICFISLYEKEKLFTKSLEVIPDLWEFKNTVLELEKDNNTDKLIDIKVSNSSYSSIGGLTTKDKEAELNKLLLRLDNTQNNELKLSILGQISTIYRDIGKLKKSLDYLNIILEIETTLKTKKSDLEITYNNISLIYQNIGELEKALDFQNKILEIRRIDNPNISTNYNNISLIYQQMGEFEKALEFQSKSLKLRENPLSVEHCNVATSYNNLSMIYKDMKELEKALYYQKKSLYLNEDLLERNHPILAQNYNNIAVIFHFMGELPKALEYHMKSLKIREEILGYKHPDLVESYNNISMLYINLKNCLKAKEYSEKSIKISNKLDYTHPMYLSVKNNLKLIESQIKKQQKAGFKKRGKYCNDI